MADQFKAFTHVRAFPNLRPGDTIDVHGVEATVVSEAEAEQCEVVVCTFLTHPLFFPDNETGPCADCGRMLQWRPHAPKKPPRVCMPCVMKRVDADG